MPEVVYPSPDIDGQPRTWDQVFTIWQVEEPNEWRIIDQILESVAMNNRFESKTPDQLRAYLKKVALDWTAERLEKTMEEVETFSKDEKGRVTAPDSWLEKRLDIFRDYGASLYYIDQVFENLGGAYRRMK